MPVLAAQLLASRIRGGVFTEGVEHFRIHRYPVVEVLFEYRARFPENPVNGMGGTSLGAAHPPSKRMGASWLHDDDAVEVVWHYRVFAQGNLRALCGHLEPGGFQSLATVRKYCAVLLDA